MDHIIRAWWHISINLFSYIFNNPFTVKLPPLPLTEQYAAKCEVKLNISLHWYFIVLTRCAASQLYKTYGLQLSSNKNKEIKWILFGGETILSSVQFSYHISTFLVSVCRGNQLCCYSHGYTLGVQNIRRLTQPCLTHVLPTHTGPSPENHCSERERE